MGTVSLPCLMLCSPLLLCFCEAFIAGMQITSTSLALAPGRRAAGTFVMMRLLLRWTVGVECADLHSLFQSVSGTCGSRALVLKKSGPTKKPALQKLTNR